MPIPSPKKNETEQQYVSRMMETKHMEGRPRDQQLATYYSTYRKARPRPGRHKARAAGYARERYKRRARRKKAG